ncbi:MAG: hypothetical protein LBC51_06175 [Treponema sp.]|jgi:hypothetical protein|nr:hypothetical protein [Treponema sp.]
MADLRSPPPTYAALIKWVQDNKHYRIHHTCWIADVKEQMGYPMKKAPNRKGIDRKVPCPNAKISDIREALEKA